MDTFVLGTAVMSLLIVMAGMLALTALTALLRRVGREPARAKAGGAAVPGVDPALLAVLTAAATEALERPVVVHRVRIHSPAQAERWSRAGRMDVMVSHRVGPKR